MSNALRKKPLRADKKQTPKRNGKVTLSPYSSFRKLRRAFNRGKLPSEREFTIAMALESAERRKATN